MLVSVRTDTKMIVFHSEELIKFSLSSDPTNKKKKKSFIYTDHLNVGSS